MATEIQTILKERATELEEYLKQYFADPRFQGDTFPEELLEALRYSLFAGGKRLRPALVQLTAAMLGHAYREVLPLAGALEMIHTYSLIHDDLPAMDDDDLRRGKATCHKQFSEAIAILAGDALLTEAFVMITDCNVAPAALVAAVKKLGTAAGAQGMVAGQAADMAAENREISLEQLCFIYAHKTGALLRSAVLLPALAFQVDADVMRALRQYGESLGLAFQIVDDILDETASSEDLGKPAGSDRRSFKSTWVSMFGLEESRRQAEEQVALAKKALKKFDPESRKPLELIADFCLSRSN